MQGEAHMRGYMCELGTKTQDVVSAFVLPKKPSLSGVFHSHLKK